MSAAQGGCPNRSAKNSSTSGTGRPPQLVAQGLDRVAELVERVHAGKVAPIYVVVESAAARPGADGDCACSPPSSWT